MERSAKARLSPEELVLRCIVCSAAIDEKRARRGSHVCGEKCKNRLDYVIAEFRRERKCPHCLSPSTPEEREEFRIWRTERPRGDGARSTLRSVEKVSRDRQLAHKHALLRALKASNMALMQEREIIARSNSTAADGEPPKFDDETAAAEYANLTVLIERNQELLDKKPEE